MSNLTGQAIFAKPEKRVSDADWMGRVAALPCVICVEFDERQTTPTTVHHVCHDRWGTRKASDRMTIPLCDGHHQGQRDTTKLAIHRSKAEWREMYGPDHSWLGWVEVQLGEDR